MVWNPCLAHPKEWSYADRLSVAEPPLLRRRVLAGWLRHPLPQATRHLGCTCLRPNIVIELPYADRANHEFKAECNQFPQIVCIFEGFDHRSWIVHLVCSFVESNYCQAVPQGHFHCSCLIFSTFLLHAPFSIMPSTSTSACWGFSRGV